MAVLKSTMIHANEGDVLRLPLEPQIWQLIFIREGSAFCSVGRNEYMLSETKNILIVPPAMDASFFPRSYCELIRIESNEQFLPGRVRPYLLHDIMETASSILWLIFRQMDRKLPNYENVVSSLTEALRHFLLAQADPGPNSDILDLERILRQNTGNHNFKLEQVLDQIPQTPSYTRRLFRRAYGCSPNIYLNNLRISEAKVLLMTRNLPVSEIAYLCGFSDAKYFARRFRQATGQTPSEFKRKHVVFSGSSRE